MKLKRTENDGERTESSKQQIGTKKVEHFQV